MRLTSIDLYSNESETLRLNLRGSELGSKYQVKGIVGLDADEIISRFYGSGSLTKTKYHDLSLKDRLIVMRISLNPNYAISESNSSIRDDIYRAIASSRTGQVTLRFNSGPTVVAIISGFITKVEVPYFEATSEFTITVKCADPMFRGINPFQVGYPELNTLQNILIADSMSTAPHGFAFQFHFTGETPSPSFTMNETGNFEWEFQISPGLLPFGGQTGFIGGDSLFVSSEYANRYVYVKRNGVNYPLMDKMTPTSVWPIIFPGDNKFTITVAGTFYWQALTYYPAYWGV